MKEVYIKMHVDHAKEIVKLLKKLSDEMYSGDDWETRSTLDERVLTITTQVDIIRGIERYEKRIKRA
jgi:IS1 family transposase